MGRTKKNFMDFIPVCNPVYTWDADKKGKVTVHVVNKGFYNWIAQKIFKRPPVSHIAEPVVPRLVKYIQILYQNKFIGYVKQK